MREGVERDNTCCALGVRWCLHKMENKYDRWRKEREFSRNPHQEIMGCRVISKGDVLMI